MTTTTKRVLFVSRQTRQAIDWQPREGVRIKISGAGDELRAELIDPPAGIATVKPALPSRPSGFTRRA